MSAKPRNQLYIEKELSLFSFHFIHFSDVWPCSELQFRKELNNVLQLVRKCKPICRIFLNITDIVPVLRGWGGKGEVKLFRNNKEVVC